MKRIVSVFLLIILIFTFVGCKTKERTVSGDEMTVYFLDVGQADCSLILFPNGKTMLIDAGNRANGPLIAKFIEKLNIKTLDYFVLTHPHEDHIGGSEDIFDEFDILTVGLPNIPAEYEPDTGIFRDVNKAIEKEKCRTLKLKSGTVIEQNESYQITALSPLQNAVYSDMNDWSLALLVDCFTNTILFSGDCEKPAEYDMLYSKISIDADILKVGHHGSKNSSTEKFLKSVTPQVSVISCGEGNSYKLPHSDAISRLEKIGSKVYRTDTVGTVIATCYDGGFDIKTDKSINLNGNK